jgi:hypothetical protein
MSIPFLTGTPPPRRQKVVDIKLQKEEGNTPCHHLWIIAVFESNLNQAKRIVIGRKMFLHLEDSNSIGSMQYMSRPGKQCQSTVLQKVLVRDITRLTRTPVAFIENNAVGCYNRLVNGIILLMLREFGISSSITNCLASLWDNTQH